MLPPSFVPNAFCLNVNREGRVWLVVSPPCLCGGACGRNMAGGCADRDKTRKISSGIFSKSTTFSGNMNISMGVYDITYVD